MILKKKVEFVLLLAILLAAAVFIPLLSNIQTGYASRTRSATPETSASSISSAESIFLVDADESDARQFLETSLTSATDDHLHQAILALQKNDVLLGDTGEPVFTYDEDKAKEHLEEYITHLDSLHDDELFIAVKQFYSVKHLFPSTFHADYFPEEIVVKNSIIRIQHGDTILDGKAVATSEFFLVKDSVTFPIYFKRPLPMPSIDAIYQGKGYTLRGKAYLDTPLPSASPDKRERERGSAITGMQAYTPTGFNQVNRSIAIILPNTTNYTLPPNTLSYLTTKLTNTVVPYFQANSEGTATYTFTLFPVDVPNYDPQNKGFDIERIVLAADPYINYNQFDMVDIHVSTSSFQNPNCCFGYANIWLNGPNTIATFATNEPLKAVVPITFFNPNDPDHIQFTEFVTEHEIGHELHTFSQNFNSNYFQGYVPHARGFDQWTYPCTTNGPIFICNNIYEYGDQLDVMGTGRGLFAHHRATHQMGLRSPSSVQSLTSSGTYTLCSTNHTRIC